MIHKMQNVQNCFYSYVLCMLQAGEITLLMADTVLLTQFHIQESGLAVDEVPTQISYILTESVRVGHIFNRIITLLWDCFMVCGLKTFIVRFKCRYLILCHF